MSRLARRSGAAGEVIGRVGDPKGTSDHELSLAEVAADVGFADQSQLSRHFKRLVGVTPGRFRMSERSA